MSKFQRSEWNALPAARRSQLAQALLKQLPAGFQFLGISSYELGGQRNEIAEYQFHADRFCLIPSDTVTLGYDASQPFKFRRDHRRHRGPKLAELAERVVQQTTRRRCCEIGPLLVEARPRAIGATVVAADDPQIAALLKQYDRGHPVLNVLGPTFQLQRDQAGVITFTRRGEFHHARHVADLKQQGFRLLTNDEWEYVCGAGASTLFRWGDEVPCDRYPNDKLADAKIVELLRNWQPGDPPWEPEQWEWGLHRRNNAFGLEIARNPYEQEIVATPGILRGGDGGEAYCGGSCYFLGWLPLATAYRCQRPANEALDMDLAGLWSRRTVSLAG